MGPDAEINLVEALAAGDLTQLDTPAADLHRMAELMRRHRDFPLGVTDASVIAAAERLNLTEVAVATLDRRHFHAITPTHAPALHLLP